MVAVPQASGSRNGRVDVPSMSVTFDEPFLKGVCSSTTITRFRIMGTGVKWVVFVLVSTNKISRVIVP